MSQETQTRTDEEDDYDVIIVGAGIGDPITVFALTFGGTKAPTLEAPLSDVTIGITLKWDQPDLRIEIGTVTIKQISTSGPHIYAIPYDDQYYDKEVNHQVPVKLFLSVSARDSRGKHVEFNNVVSIGNGQYVMPGQELIPQYFDTINSLLAEYGKK